MGTLPLRKCLRQPANESSIPRCGVNPLFISLVTWLGQSPQLGAIHYYNPVPTAFGGGFYAFEVALAIHPYIGCQIGKLMKKITIGLALLLPNVSAQAETDDRERICPEEFIQRHKSSQKVLEPSYLNNKLCLHHLSH